MRPVLFALFLIAASPAFAQRNTAPAPTQRSLSTQRGTVATANDRLVDEAIQGFGVNPNRLPAPSVSDAFAELYPNTPYERTRLTPVQARAIAFTALAFAAERVGRAQGPNDSYYPPGQGGYPDPGYPDPNRPGGISLQANASALAYEFLLTVGDGDDLNEAQRDAAVRQGSEAAAAAAAAGCTPLASAIREIAGDLRSVGHAFSLDVEAAEQAADACR